MTDQPKPEHQPLPVHGYTSQVDWRVTLVNENKVIEERVLRSIDNHLHHDDIDARCVALARTKLQEAFMWLNRAVFRPQRLPDEQVPDLIPKERKP